MRFVLWMSVLFSITKIFPNTALDTFEVIISVIVSIVLFIMDLSEISANS